MEDHRSQQKANTLGSTINGASQATGLARQMEVQVESQEVVEYISRYLADCLLRNTCKDRIAKLLKECCSNSGSAI